MDDYKCCTLCLNIHEIWHNKKVSLFEDYCQGTVLFYLLIFLTQQILRCLGYILLAVSLVKKIEVYFQTPNFGHDNLISFSGIKREFDFGSAKSLFKSHFTIVNSLF